MCLKLMPNIETDIALLAPVPDVHLQSARSMRRVAFGSRSNVIWRLEQLRNNENVSVYIYASCAGLYESAATWKATYVGMVEAVGGAYPDRDRAKVVRPESTERDTDDAFLFWEVEDLVELSKLPE